MWTGRFLPKNVFLLIRCDSYKTTEESLLPPDKRRSQGTVAACAVLWCIENTTSLRQRWRKKGVKGGAKCCGAVCPHKIIQVAVVTHVIWHQCICDLGKEREESDRRG